MAALQGAEGAVPKDQENGRSRLLPEVASAAWAAAEQAGRPPVEASAASCRGHPPADRVLGALPVARLGAHLEARHRPLVAAGESEQAPADQARPPGPRASAVARKRQPRALRGPLALESRGERKPARAKPNRALALGKLLERRAAPKRPPGSRVAGGGQKRARPGGALVPAPKAGLRPADGVAEAERAPVPGGAPGDRFSFPRAQCPRRGYSQVAALFLKYYCRCGRALFPVRLSVWPRLFLD